MPKQPIVSALGHCVKFFASVHGFDLLCLLSSLLKKQNNVRLDNFAQCEIIYLYFEAKQYTDPFVY